MQVCSTWHSVSRSELLWQNLTRRIWGRHRLLHATWRQEYIHLHKTASNFRARRAAYTPLQFGASSPSEQNDSMSCRRVALSLRHLACGFIDGSVRLFDLFDLRHAQILRPVHRGLFGEFSRAVAGIVLHDDRVVWALLGGDVHVASAVGEPSPGLAYAGNVVNDGTLVDFAGCRRWWVGLYAGVPGRAFRVWNGETGEVVFEGGALTDPDSVQGWHLLTNPAMPVGRVRLDRTQDSDADVEGDILGLACTGRRMMVLNLLHNHGGLLFGDDLDVGRRGVIVDSVDVCNGLFLAIDNRGLARVRQVHTLEPVYVFSVREVGWGGRVHGCMNSGYALVCAGGVVWAWDIEQRVFSGNLEEALGLRASDLVMDEERAAGCSSDTGIHLWDFSPPPL